MEKIIDPENQYVEVTLTVSFPGEYVHEVYKGEVTDENVSEMFAEYLGSVNLADLMPTWEVR